ncbi:MAG: hypothetical protein HKO92_11430 [Flavobacteriaceae bacterium]|nr:hypothetical protein [Flavobacteriaceae bacterium]
MFNKEDHLLFDYQNEFIYTKQSLDRFYYNKMLSYLNEKVIDGNLRFRIYKYLKNKIETETVLNLGEYTKYIMSQKLSENIDV